MVRKIDHGIATCAECAKIILFLVSPKIQPVRFNQLLRLCRKGIDPKYSAPRLQRHLKGLVGKFVTRTEKSPQEVTYSLLVPKKTLELVERMVQEEVRNLEELPLQQLIKLELEFYRFIGREQIISEIERTLKRISPQEQIQKNTFLSILAETKIAEFDHAMANRPESEYIEVLKELKNERRRKILLK